MSSTFYIARNLHYLAFNSHYLACNSHRWVWLGDHLPWEAYEKMYGQTLNNQKAGASAKPARMVIGALIVKHITRLSDQDTIEMIQENPYMQYLCGLEEFTDQPRLR